MVLPCVASGWLRDLLKNGGAQVDYEPHLRLKLAPSLTPPLTPRNPRPNSNPSPDPVIRCLTSTQVTYELHAGGHDLGGAAVLQKIAAHWAAAM